MAYTLPDFNLQCDIYRGPWLSRTIALAAEPCNLAFSRRVARQDVFQDNDNYAITPYLLLNPLVDVRDLKCAAVEDVVEVPAGSGRWYQVGSVDDIGKGFSNEHRCAMIFPISDALYPTGSYPGLLWPAPIP